MTRQAWAMLGVGLFMGVVLTLATTGAAPRGGLLQLCPVPAAAPIPAAVLDAAQKASFPGDAK